MLIFLIFIKALTPIIFITDKCSSFSTLQENSLSMVELILVFSTENLILS